ncbi:hypothetical protein HWC26_gp076 [Aeromonas phage 2L372X]|uniref:Uncharacterized protein n=2 Tax=Plateaulakevirus TaxID=2843436 RepID=A0A5B9N2S9_9CAUD|nr:hypothetical protein HWC25_gp077 [Aeromonas phage 2L372D]YP_009846413.1 hypothetical protein HWC26_gp076 [Aeromonas phage 2L372X]QDB73991.1 hypothetical protein 2L372D_077 [Aeromonas phage 2L372D]QEG08328.1 hypothetical protein [Aeromonas phage 2L372X]
MPVEIFFTIGKALWLLLTAGLSWLLSQLWGDYKDFKKDSTERFNQLNQKFIKLEAMAVTQDKLDETLDRKMGPIKDQITRLDSKLDDKFDDVMREIKELIKDQNRK